MNKEKGFSSLELLISFIIISLLTTAMFRTVLVLNNKLFYYQHTSVLTIFRGTIMNIIQKDLMENGLSNIVSCGSNCYNIVFSGGNSKRLELNIDNKTLKYGNFAESLSKDASFIDDITLTNETIDGISAGKYNKILNIKIPIKSDIYDERYDINIVYQYTD